MTGTAQSLATVEITETAQNNWVASFLVDDSFPGVSAHFPSMPLIAGYMQLSWVEILMSKVAPTLRIKRIIETKFSGKLVPPVELSVCMELRRQDETLRFSIADADGVKSHGRLLIGESQ